MFWKIVHNGHTDRFTKVGGIGLLQNKKLSPSEHDFLHKNYKKAKKSRADGNHFLFYKKPITPTLANRFECSLSTFFQNIPIPKSISSIMSAVKFVDFCISKMTLFYRKSTKITTKSYDREMTEITRRTQKTVVEAVDVVD